MTISTVIRLSVNGRHRGLINLETSMKSALNWIVTAHRVCSRRGISKGYDLVRDRWAPPYPETTGYIIPTLLNLSRLYKDQIIAMLAFELADYLMDQAALRGGIVHWQAAGQGEPIVFDTGQVMFGWLAAFQARQEIRYLNAAQKAGDWLVAIQDSNGAWMKNQHLGIAKVIDTRVAWALLELYRKLKNDKYRDSAIRNLEWALQQQQSDGWFAHCAFASHDNPLTHTLAYTAEGLLECGLILSESRYINAARLTADAVRMQMRQDGSLPGCFGPGWKPASRSSCLTGICQMVRLWLSLFSLNGQHDYQRAAEAAIRFVTSTQVINTSDEKIRGGIAGSYPIYGSYERFKFPNWAAKFYIDAILTQLQIDGQGSSQLEFVG
jgi:uncharacterized protein YyaL (SSP411 family)